MRRGFGLLALAVLFACTSLVYPEDLTGRFVPVSKTGEPGALPHIPPKGLIVDLFT